MAGAMTRSYRAKPGGVQGARANASGALSASAASGGAGGPIAASVPDPERVELRCPADTAAAYCLGSGKRGVRPFVTT